MAEGLRVGYAYVEIRPNTQGFRASLRRELKKAKKNIHVVIPVRADADALIRDAKNAVASAEKVAGDIDVDMDLDASRLARDAKGAVESAEKVAGDIDVKTDLDASRLARDAKSAVAAAEKVAGSLRVKPDLDSRKLAAETQRARDAVEKALRDFKIGMDVDGRGLDRKARRAVAAAQAAVGDIDLGMDVNSARAYAKITSAISKMKALMPDLDVDLDLKPPPPGRIAVIREAVQAKLRAVELKIRTAVDHRVFTRLASVAGSLTRAVGASLSVLGKLSAVVVAVGGAFALAAPAMAAMTSGLASATVAAGGLIGVLALPALTGIALGVGTLVMAFKGLGEAISAESAEDLTAAIEGMQPATAGAAVALNGLVGKLREVGPAVQENFWLNMAPMERFQGIIGELGVALEGMAMDFGNAAAGATNFITSGLGFASVKQLIHGSADAVSNLFSALMAAVPGIAAVGAVGAKILGELTHNIERVADAWSSRMVLGFASGSLEATVRGWIDSLGNAWERITEFGGLISGIFGGVFVAATASATGGINGLFGALSQVNIAINSMSGQAALTTFFNSTGQAVSSILPILGALGSLIGGHIAPAFSDFVVNAAPGIRAFFENLPTVLAPVLAQLPALGKALSDLIGKIDLTAIGEALGIVGTILTSAILPALNFIAPIFGELAVLVLSFVGTLKALQIGIAAVNVVMALNPFGAVALAIGAVIAALVALWKSNEGFREFIIGAWEAIKSAFSVAIEAIKSLASGLVDAWHGVWDFFAGLPDFFSNLWSTITQKVSDFAAGCKQLFTDFTEAVKATITGWIANILAFVEDWKANWRQKISDGLNAAWDLFITMLDAIVKRVAQWVYQFIDAVTGLWRKAVEIFTFLKNDGPRIILEMVTSALSTVARFVRDFIDAGVNLARRIPSLMKQLATSAISRIQEMAQSIGSRVGDFVRDIPQLISRMKDYAVAEFHRLKDLAIEKIMGLYHRVTGAFGDLRNAASSKVVELRDAALDRFREMVDGLADWARSIPERILDGIGNLAHIGRDMINQIKDGFESKIREVGGVFAKYFGGGGREAAFAAASNIGESLTTVVAEVKAASIGDTLAADVEQGVKKAQESLDSLAVTGLDARVAGAKNPFTATGGIGDLLASNASVDLFSHGAGSQADYSIHIDTLYTADPSAARRELETMQTRQRIRGGRR